jgi:hypothetical protein
VRGRACPCRVLPVDVLTGHCSVLAFAALSMGPALAPFALAERRILGGLTGALKGRCRLSVRHGANWQKGQRLRSTATLLTTEVGGHNLQGLGGSRRLPLSLGFLDAEQAIQTRHSRRRSIIGGLICRRSLTHVLPPRL